MKKQLCSLLCAAVMAFSGVSAMPAEVFAAVQTEGIEESGKCGENLTWTLGYNRDDYDGESVLRISGTGAMYDYYYKSDGSPFSGGRMLFKHIVIEPGVTSIGVRAFYNFDDGYVASIEIPDTVTSIGAAAFARDSIHNITTPRLNITLPESVEFIADSAFSNFANLAEVSVWNPDCKISGSFYKRVNLVGFQGSTTQAYAEKYGYSFTAIPTGLSGECGEHHTWKITDGVLNVRGSGAMPEFTNFMAAPWSKYNHLIRRITLESGITSIGAHSFEYMDQLRSAVLPDGITSLGAGAFDGSKQLTAIELPESLMSVGDYALSDCAFQEIILPARVSRVESWAFHSCDNLKHLTFQNPNCQIYDAEETIPAPTVIHGYHNSTAEAYAEKYKRSFETMGEPETTAATSAATDPAAAVTTANSTANETSGECGKHLTWKYDEASGTLTISGQGEMSANPAWSVFRQKIKLVTVGEGVTTLGDNAFSGCSSLMNISLPKSLTKIGQGAFMECTALQAVELPKNTVLGEQVFYKCENLSVVMLPENLTEIPFSTFGYCTHLSSVLIPETVKTIGFNAFIECHDLETIDLPASVETIGNTAFKNLTALKDIYIRNPECSIVLSPSTICNASASQTQTAVIHGYHNSTAEAYAKKYNRAFEALDEPETTAATSAATTSTTTTTTTTTSTTTTTTTTTSTTTTTTTTTSTTTTTTTTATSTTTTTTTTTTTATTAAPAPQFQWGYDNWGFLNSKQNLGKLDSETMQFMYDISGADVQRLYGGLSNIEREKISRVLAERTHGSCYGMAVTSILQNRGFFRAEDLVSGVDNIGAITSKNINASVRSSVNYYQMLQYTKAVSQKVYQTQRQSDEGKLKALIAAVSGGHPTLLGYTFEREDHSTAGHAVVAYGIETGAREVIQFSGNEYKQFDTEIRIYNNDVLTNDSKYNMLINTKTWEWCIPMTNVQQELNALAIMNLSNHRNGNITLVSDDIEMLNFHGKFGGNTTYRFDESVQYYAAMTMIPMETRYRLKAAKDPYDGSFNDDGDDGDIELTADFFGDDDGTGRIGASMDSARSYDLTLTEPRPVGISMEYQNCLLNVSADLAGKVTVSPKARVACGNVTGKYTLSMVLDEGCHATDWYKLSVSGSSGGDLLLTNYPEDNGFLMTGDSLKNVAVQANNDQHSAAARFSTECKKVLIYEIDADTIGIKADADGDGKFETPLDTNAAETVTRGDVDGDGEATSTDAQLVLVAYTEALASGKQGFTGEKFTAADVDNDGTITAADAQYILIYFVQRNVVGDPKTWDELIQSGAK